jgi:acetylornithine deacetylase
MQHSAVNLLRKLISLQSFSGEEQLRSDFLTEYFAALRLHSATNGISVERIDNNLIVKQKNFDVSKQTMMLNSHLDTVKPSASYTFDPINPPLSDTHIYGLGSNDAGASVVAMIETFLHFYDKELPFNLLLALSCEEENSGANGMKMLWNEHLANIVNFAIIGEPTEMKAAIAERGLLVIDGEAKGVSGHAARNEGVNALYIALEDIQTLKSTKFDKISPTMGEVKLTVTQINAGTQHNVVPDKCTFVADIRPTEMYDNQQIMDILQPKVKSELKARNLTNKSSAAPTNHLLMQAIERLRIETYTSPTTSDWMRITCPAVKMGPGNSARSHQADEFVLISELEDGIKKYIQFIGNI